MRHHYEDETQYDRDADRYAEHNPKVLRCKACGSDEVRWRQQGGKWVLFSNLPGVVHQCNVDDSDFTAVPE